MRPIHPSHPSLASSPPVQMAHTSTPMIPAIVSTDPGYYAEGGGSTAQNPCPPGSYQASSGEGTCDPSDPGNYSSGSASTSQTQCSPGTYQPASNTTSCIDASPGHIAPDPARPAKLHVVSEPIKRRVVRSHVMMRTPDTSLEQRGHPPRRSAPLGATNPHQRRPVALPRTPSAITPASAGATSQTHVMMRRRHLPTECQPYCVHR